MVYDRAALIARSRKTVHAVQAIPANYEHPSYPGVVTVLSVRWHNRSVLHGNMVEAGYNDIIEGINRIIFDQDELNEKGVVPERGGVVTLTAPAYNSIALILDSQDPTTGPVNNSWLAVKP